MGKTAPVAVTGREPAVGGEDDQVVGQGHDRAGVERPDKGLAGRVRAVQGMGGVVEDHQGAVREPGQARTVAVVVVEDFRG